MYFENIETNQSRLGILNSLLKLLEKKDYSAITINMIVEHAGLGRRTFYRYFKTKDDAMKYITKLLMDQFANNIISNHASGMKEVTIAYFQFWGLQKFTKTTTTHFPSNLQVFGKPPYSGARKIPINRLRKWQK